jgi:UDP-N-acetylglucosamine 2-epimerase
VPIKEVFMIGRLVYFQGKNILNDLKMKSQKKITILIPIMRPPDVESVDVKAVNNIMNKLEEKITVKQVWIIFQNSKFKIQNSKHIEVIHFEDFKNAIDIIEKFQPELILFDGELTIPSLAFALAGRKKEIPTVGIFLIPEIGKGSSRWLKNRIQMIFSEKPFTDVKIESQLEEDTAMKFLLREYKFLLRTVKKMNFNILEWIKFFINYPRVQLFSKYNIAHHKINEAVLTLCSTNSWKEQLEKQGFNPKKTKVIGTPLYDDLFNKTKGIEFNKTKSKKIKILFCVGGMHEHGIWSKKTEHKLIKNTINKLSEYKDFQISFKIHPVSASIDEYKKLIKENKWELKIYQKERFLELIKEYDVILAYTPSSIIHECVLLRKPIVLLQVSNQSATESVYNENIISVCRNLDDIFNDLNEAQNKKIERDVKDELIEKLIGKFDGKCSERAVNEILDIIK